MRETWRWFGPDDPVSLDNARQAGAQGIVTALHHIYDGRAWSDDDVAARQRAVEAAGLTWDVCESIPVSAAIKLRQGPYRRDIDAWKDSLASLVRSGVATVCYNFMPVVDWTRTDLAYPTPSKGLALRFDMPAFVAYDVFVLERPGAEADYSAAALAAARARRATLDDAAFATIERNVVGGMPARQAEYTRQGFAEALRPYAGLKPADLRANLFAFVAEIAPVAEALGARLAIHPDDPPFSLFGLPRVVSTAADYRALFAAVPTSANGMTLVRRLARLARRQRPRRDGARIRRRASISPICATSRARPTDRSSRPSISTATSTWLRWFRPCLTKRRAGGARAAPTLKSRCGPITAIVSPTTSARRASIPAILASAG
jgi:mannonate dehydratase